MAYLSLLLNIVVLVPVCTGLLTDASWATEAYGPASPARSILTSVYLAILIASAVLLFNGNPQYITALLAIQVIYKFTTPFTVGSTQHPVVVSNLWIAAFHTLTLITLWWRSA